MIHTKKGYYIWWI